MREVHVLPCGYEKGDMSSLTLLKHAGTSVNIPYHIYLIEDSDFTILVDTGTSIHWRELHPKELNEAWPIQIEPDEYPDRILDSLGLSPDDIDYVINTHLHYDHCGNNAMFPKSTFLVNEDEVTHALAPGWWESLCYVRAVFDLPNLKYQKINGDFDLKPGVKIIPTPGHTEGHQSVVVKLEETGTLVLAGDAIYLRENLEGPVLPGLYVDAKRFARSMSCLQHIVDLAHGCMLLSHSHEYLSPQGWKLLGKGISTFR
ncbi:MAG TPA: N-acyl homoserine lactonase family protein [Candidatus Bathyarchaeia archaeon]|nr:N-acyl homoserine lactonase family protein [Candidatus Bathyarchaeia archaeon]